MNKPLYESSEMLDISGGVLRPGGIELTKRALGLCAFEIGDRILDLGCGPGRTSLLLKEEFNLVPLAMDLSSSMLCKAADGVKGLDRVRADGRFLPFAHESLKGVVSECVLSLTGNISATLSEISRILVPGGKAIISDIYSRKNCHTDFSQIGVECCFKGALPLSQIERAIVGAGLEVSLIEDHTALLKQLAGQIIFNMGSLEKFWSLFMDRENASGTCNAVNAMMPGYYLLIAEKRN